MNESLYRLSWIKLSISCNVTKRILLSFIREICQTRFHWKMTMKVEFTVCRFSSNGKLLAADSSKWELIIFDVLPKKIDGGDVKPMEMNVTTVIACNPDQNKFRGKLPICDTSDRKWKGVRTNKGLHWWKMMEQIMNFINIQQKTFFFF